MSLNLGNVVGLIKSETAPDKTYILWAKILNPLYPDVVKIYQHNGTKWLPVALDYKGAWVSGNNYEENDLVTRLGYVYVCKLAINNSTTAPASDTTHFDVYSAPGSKGDAGDKGDKGDTGDVGPGYAATSSSSLTLGTGLKSFTTQFGLAYNQGTRAKATKSGDNTKFLEGVVHSYSGNTLVIDVDTFGGSGTVNNWLLNLSGKKGDIGLAGLISVFDHYSNVGNLGVGSEDNLALATLPAVNFGSEGCKYVMEFNGTSVISATASRRLRFYYNSTLIFDTGNLIYNTTDNWHVKVTIMRVASDTIKYSITYKDGENPDMLEVGSLGSLVLSSDKNISLTSEVNNAGAAAGDIVYTMGFGYALNKA
jgi:hypothetical protein